MRKTIGIIGGVSWESTVLYYKLINETVRERLGGLNSAKLLLYSLNYHPIIELERNDKWDEVGTILGNAAKSLQDAGAEFVILGCNTLHKVTASIEGAIQIPFLHIADAAGAVLAKRGIKKVGLLGTQFTMEEGFYSSRLKQKFALGVVTPHLQHRKRMDSIIYKELCLGKVHPDSKMEAIKMMEELRDNGAEAVLLACTELGMLIQKEDTDIPFYDTAVLHAKSAVDLYIGQ